MATHAYLRENAGNKAENTFSGKVATRAFKH